MYRIAISMRISSDANEAIYPEAELHSAGRNAVNDNKK